MDHPIILTLKHRRADRSGDTGVLWKELDLIIELLEDIMEGITQTEEGLAKLKADSEARDAATSQAITDLKAEVAKVEGQGVDTTAINASISALDAAVKTGTSEAQAADPGAQAAQPPQPTTESVQVSVGPSGEGTTTVDKPLAQVGISTQPASGTASVEAVEGDPTKATVKVINATPNQPVTVEIAVVAAA